MRPTRLLALGTTTLALTAATASAAQAQGLSPTAKASCQHAHLLHTLCANGGHYAKVGGHRVFMFNQSVAPKAHASALGWQYLNNQGNVRCLSKFSPNGNWTGMYICNLSANQTWNVFTWSASSWGLQNKGNGNCLNNAGGRPTVGNVQITYQCQNVFNERYLLNANRGGFTMRAAINSEIGGQGWSGQCVSSYGSLRDGDPAQLSGCNNSANQTWGRS